MSIHTHTHIHTTPDEHARNVLRGCGLIAAGALMLPGLLLLACRYLFGWPS